MIAQTTTQRTKSNLLSRVLQANGLFSGLSGIMLTFAAGPIATFLGLNSPMILVGIGIALILYAPALFYVAAQTPINRKLVMTAIILDVAWVIGSIDLLVTDWVPLTTVGWWAVAIVADIVAVFAIVQYYALRRQSE